MGQRAVTFSSRLSSRFDAWCSLQDTPVVRASATVSSWTGILALVLVILAFTSLVPGSRDFFGVPFLPGLLAFLPSYALGVVFSVALRRPVPVGPRLIGAMVLAGNTGLQFFTAALVALARPSGAAVFASFLILTASYHGYAHRNAPRFGFPTVGTVIAITASLALNGSGEHLAVLAVAAPAAITGNLLLGNYALHADALRAQAEQLRAAVTAQMLAEQSDHVRRLSGALVEVLGRNHDVTNALVVARINADLLSSMTRDAKAATLDAAEVHEIVKDITGGLARVKVVFDEAKSIAQRGVQSVPSQELVDARAVIEAVVAEIRTRFWAVRVSPPSFSGAVRVTVSGGAITLHRILENLLVNACEGDGSRRATTVDIDVEVVDSRARIAIADDGPGFAAGFAEGPIAGFSTTKDGGTGLGLYTVERLIRASGGLLSRANRAQGGAMVTIELPIEARG